jgi:recombination associated protein RdgC
MKNNLWFKNLQIYKFNEDFDFSIENLEAALREYPYKPCLKILPGTAGWVAPIGDSDNAPLIHAANGVYLLSLRVEKKLLPASVVKEHLQIKLAEIEESHGRKLSSKEKLQLRDDVYCTLLPQAFTKNEYINAMIDSVNKLLIIDAASRNKAEDFIMLLRKTIGSVPVALPETASPSIIMTNWLKHDELPKNLGFGNNCVLKNVDEIGVVRCDKQDILSDKVTAFLDSGAQVKQLQLYWKEHLQFTLKDNLSIAQIKYTDAVQDLAAEIHTDTEEQQQDASFFIMSQTVVEFVRSILGLFERVDFDVAQGGD